MTQGSNGTAGYLRLFNNKEYNKDYYERNKEKLMRRRKQAKIQKKRNEEFILSKTKCLK